MEIISGRDLSVLLRKKSITQKELSEVLGVNRSQLSQYLNDRHLMPSNVLIGIMLYANIPLMDMIAVPPPQRSEPERQRSYTGMDIEDAEYSDIPQLAAEPSTEYGYKGIETLLERMRTETRVEILREQVVDLAEQVLWMLKNKEK